MLQSKNGCGIIEVRDGYVICPVCRQNKKLLRITGETEATRLPVYCRCCKNEIVLDIQGQSVKRRSQ